MFLGVDVGGTNLKIGVVSSRNYIIDMGSEPTPKDIEPSEFVNLLVFRIKEYLRKYPAIESVGIGLPGVINNVGQIIVAPNLPNWTMYPFASEISRHFRLPVAIENDANIAGFAELKEGVGRNFRNFMYVTLGTGVGAAIFLNGELYRGMTGNAGELGQMIINAISTEDENLKPFQRGSLEHYTGKNGILRIANKTAEDMGMDKNFTGVKEIEEAANEGCPSADYTLKTVGAYLGCGFVSAMNLLDIHNIVLGGGISKSNRIFNSIQETIKKRALPHIANSFTLQNARFSENTGILGAALYGKYFK
jgi:glucokinase